MLELDKILVVIEPDSESQPALEKAVQLAEYADSELELITADYNPYLERSYYFDDPIQTEKIRDEHDEQQRQKMEAIAVLLRDQGLKVSVTSAWGNPPYEEIVRYVEKSKPSIVIKSTHRHNKLSRLLLSNEDWELIRYCPTPLLLTKSQQWRSNPVFLAAVDPGHMNDKSAALDHKIIESAQSLSAISGGEVHLFHSAWMPPLAGVYKLHADNEEESNKLSALAEANEVCSSMCHLSNEYLVDSLPALARELDASALVIGAVSRSRLDRVLIGSMAEKVLDNLQCDVLIVKTDDMAARTKALL
jgi:universal stress protein E